MTKHPVIFDWSKAEASRKDFFYSLVIVGLLFAFIIGSIKLNLPSQHRDSDEAGTLIRMVDADMAKSWALAAVENGPFPGRLETVGDYDGLMSENNEMLGWWRDYKVSLRPMRREANVANLSITPKGKREFPIIPAMKEHTSNHAPSTASQPGEPILVPYDAAALEWLPDKPPSFDFPIAKDWTADSLRFLVSLREDGSVAELIPLAGATDTSQEPLESWLRGIRFRRGDGVRWFGLRIDFVNNRSNESDPQ